MSEQTPALWPRDRLLERGARALNDTELVSVMIGSARLPPDESLALAEQLLESFDGPQGLSQASLTHLMRARGIGPVRAARLRASFELFRRIGPVEAPVDPITQHVDRLRGQVPTGERAILAYRPDLLDQAPVTLDLGTELGSATRCGALLARMLKVDTEAAWWIVAVRPRGRVKKAERDVAGRLSAAADLLGVQLERVLLLAGDEVAFLVER